MMTIFSMIMTLFFFFDSITLPGLILDSFLSVSLSSQLFYFFRRVSKETWNGDLNGLSLDVASIVSNNEMTRQI